MRNQNRFQANPPESCSKKENNPFRRDYGGDTKKSSVFDMIRNNIFGVEFPVGGQ